MATVTPTVTQAIGTYDGSLIAYTWAITTANADGAPIEWCEWADRNFTATGTWGGATLTVEGSADGTTWVPLNNAAGGAAATATANKSMQIIEIPRYVRPNLTTVGAGATLTVTMLARRANPMRA